MTTKNHIENVAVVGAGGNMGSYIVDAMLQEGKHKITAITRPDSDSKIPEGVTVKKVNYDSAEELADALKGQDALIITLSARAAPEQQLRLIEAAAAANVRWIMPNAWGYDVQNKQLRVDTLLDGRWGPVVDRIKELGKSSWVALSCGFWYEWSLGGGTLDIAPEMYGFDLRNHAVTFYDDGNTKINTSTWPQAGLAVARLLALKEKADGSDDKSATLEQFKNGFVYVSSFLASQKDMFESVLRVSGTKESDWKAEYVNHQDRYNDGLKRMQGGDMRGFAQQMYARVFYPNGDGNFEAKYGLNNELLGLPQESIDEATKAAYAYAKISL
ncbi:MAG: hypothetical protein M1820_006384 [Bogoriella megaspora]|nr:MAG: hypothetical protein M1820_006384 [Bogoriella megaspora]